MKKDIITGEFKRKKRRAIELYHANSPFKGKVEDTGKKSRKRKPKHFKNFLDEQE
jgi:hypothetical protein